MVEKGGIVSAKMCPLMHSLPTTLNTNKKMKYKNFLHEVARSCTSEVQNPINSSSNELHWPEKQPTPRGPKQEPPKQTLRGFQQTQTGQNVCWWKGQEEVSCKTV
jgi:hypothetical protein